MIDFSQVLYAVDGTTPLRMSNAEGAPEIALRDAAVMALVSKYDDERNLPPLKTFERGELARIVARAKKPVKLKSEDITLLKDLIAKLLGPAVTVAAWPLLDPAVKLRGEDDEPKK